MGFPLDLNLLNEEDYKTLLGVNQELFHEIYQHYCLDGGPINSPDQLFHILYFIKTYPTLRHMKCLLQQQRHTKVDAYLYRRIKYLASQMKDIIPHEWNTRHTTTRNHDIDLFFGRSCLGAIDSFPIRICRPKSSVWRRGTYNGKYKTFVTKVQVICNHEGVPVWMSGPHAGTIHDVVLFRHYCPDLGHNTLLADKAYVGAYPPLITPFKKRPNHNVSEEQNDFNLVLSWYRATIEHLFSQYKKFNIIGTKYRGKIWADGGERLKAVLGLIGAIVALQIKKRPLKNLARTILTVQQQQDAKTHVEVKRPERKSMYGLPLGDSRDIFARRLPDGSITWIGSNPEPDCKGIDLGFRAADFVRGQHILCWWWGVWWPGTVLYVSSQSETLNIRWDRDGSETKKQPTCLCRPM